MIKVAMIGDVMGEPGLAVLEELLPGFIRNEAPDFVMVNGENSAGGFGVTEETLKRMLAAGADIVSSGNHIWEKRNFWETLDSEKRILRPANYPEGPGRGWMAAVREINGAKICFLAVNLAGRELLNPIDCPFRCFDSIYAAKNNIPPEHILSGETGLPPELTEKAVVLVDFHAETGREKEAFGFYLDGRAAVVAGTHTHVQTADEKILPRGTAYISDLGMTGVTDGVIGMEAKICVDRVRNQVLYRMEAAAGNGRAAVQGITVHIDEAAGKAVSVRRFNLKNQ